MTTLPAAVDLRTEGRVDPLGLDEPQPRLSWRVDLAPGAAEQASARVEVATHPAFHRSHRIWSADVGGSDAAVAFDGHAGASRGRRYWRVRLTDDLGRRGDWSAPASWEMGLLQPGDWAARWIGWIDPALASWSSRSPLLRGVVRVRAPVVRARAYVSALGLAELTINGRVVGGDRMLPGWTDYRRRIQYETSDVAALLQPGENVIAARLGRGWFAGDVASFGAEQYGDYPALLAQLEVVLAGGRRQRFVTDTAWRAHPGPLVADDLLMGEAIDARDEPTGWREPGFDDRDWHAVVLSAGPGGALVARRDAGVGIVDELAAQRISDAAGGRIVDFGQNIAGHVRIHVGMAGGQTLTVRHAEVLDDRGELYTANLRGARQTDSYVARGDADEVFEPRFTTHGFRYAEVSGPVGDLDPSRVTARAVSSIRRQVGSFECSDELVNAIHRNIWWGLRGGLVGLPTDCPQRDERLGWTADAAAMAPGALFLGDAAPLFEKWLIDLADAQLPSGAYPDVAPAIGVTGAGNTGWADAGIQIPWLLYERTGDRSVVARQYDSMRRYIRFLEADQSGGIRHGGRYGDWLTLDDVTSFELLGTAYLAHSAALFARMARMLGRDPDAEEAGRLAGRATAAFRRRFTNGQGRLHHETQTGYALALAFGLLPRAVRRTATDRLASLIERAGGHILTGFLGTAAVLPALSSGGHHELAVQVIREDTFPSLGYQVRQGATTVWERWDSWTPERGFADPGMNSFNHAALGSVADWLHGELGAIAPGTPGYRTMLVRPRPAAGLERARTSHESAHGEHSVAWQTDDRDLEVSLGIPPNTFADVVVPRGARSIHVDGARARAGVGPVRSLTLSGSERHLVLSWGRHVVNVER